MIRQQLVPAKGSKNVIQQTSGMKEMIRGSWSSKYSTVEMVEKFLLFLTDWQRHLSSLLLAKHLKEKKNVKLYYLEVQYVNQACNRAGHISSDKI